MTIVQYSGKLLTEVFWRIIPVIFIFRYTSISSIYRARASSLHIFEACEPFRSSNITKKIIPESGWHPFFLHISTGPVNFTSVAWSQLHYDHPSHIAQNKPTINVLVSVDTPPPCMSNTTRSTLRQKLIYSCSFVAHLCNNLQQARIAEDCHICTKIATISTCFNFRSITYNSWLYIILDV